MGLTIHKISDNAYLHHHYPGQIEPQPCYIELDCDDGSLCADWDGEIGNATPVSVWHRRTLRFDIPALKGHKANELLADIEPLAERVVAGYESDWDGNNWVGTYSDDAEDAIGDIQSLIASYYLHDPDWALMVWDAGDYMDGVGDLEAQAAELGVTADSTDDQLATIGEKLQEEGRINGDADLISNTDEYLEELRDHLRELRDDEED
ncbi:MAG: hypothetical protein KJO40_13640 [Deltaproteobacteria bacterium]|nr:hypothetical protein [Deltaproteobacteria bacterium]